VLHLYGYDYGNPTPEPILKSWEEYDQIFIVDLAVEELMDRLELRPKIVWIDHHKTSIELYKFVEFKGVRLDGVAACRLAWWWFNTFEATPRLESFQLRLYHEPMIVTLIGEYDVWFHRDANWKETIRVLFNDDRDALKTLISGGKIIAYYLKNVSARYAHANVHEIVFHDLKFLCLNGAKGSQAFDAVLYMHVNGVDIIRPDIDGLFAWTHNGNEVSVSLYGVPGKDIDLSAIAVEHDGGGHKGACGFRMTLHELAELLFNQPIPEGEKISTESESLPSSSAS
jgi:hypothetical protein